MCDQADVFNAFHFFARQSVPNPCCQLRRPVSAVLEAFDPFEQSTVVDGQQMNDWLSWSPFVERLEKHGNAGFAGVYQQSVCTTAVFPVSAGNNTIFLVGEIDGGGNGLNHQAVDASLTLAFFPTAHGTVSSMTLADRGEQSIDSPATR